LLFFKRKDKKIEKLGSDSVVNSQELLGQSVEVANDALVKTNLHFSPGIEIDEGDRYYYQFLHNELPPLKPNQISISGIEIKNVGQEWHIAAFIRHTIGTGLHLSQMHLVLLGPDGEKLARKTFDLNTAGLLPINSSTPWIFVFEPSFKLAEEFPAEGWMLAFETPKHRLDLADSWEEHLPSEEKEKLQKLIETIPPPRMDEVDLHGLSGRVVESGNLHITILIRNGKNTPITLEQLPLLVEDASGEVAAQGVFNFEDFHVKSFASKPWTFVFPKEMIVKENADFSSWRAYPPQAKN
jgi:accessory Sec system S-layer assembly protein